MNLLSSKDKEFIWHPFTAVEGAPENILIKSGKGAYLFTSDGRKIIDAVSSWWVNIHGHANEYIANAISQQARTLEHVIFAGFTHEPAINISERLLQILPGEQKKVFFSDNGSTSVEVAIKMAVQYWFNQGKKRTKLIALEGAYHGDTFGAMAVAERGPFSKPFHSMLFDVEFLDFPIEDNQKTVIEKFKALVSNDDVAAFIYEPLVQGAAGMRIYSQEVLEELLVIAKEKEIVCIADEVMTGFGRTGKLFASQYLKTTPDIICLSKGITGGFMALGVTTCNQRIAEKFKSNNKEKTFYHGHSYTANAMTCAAANASLDLLLSNECKERIRNIENRNRAFLEEIKGHSKVKSVKALGTILSIELVTSQDTDYFNSSRDYFYRFFLDKDILLRPLGNIIYFFPPYVIKNEDIDRVFDSIKELLIKMK